MAPFVLDASVTMAWCFADQGTAFTAQLQALLRKRQTYALTPELWPFEIANTLSMAERRGRISRQATATFLEELRTLPIQVERREAFWICQEIVWLTRSFRVSAYDAAYLNLAKRDRIPLATLDEELQAAAKAAGVPLVEITDPALS
jgi:predicted nucleic acid-binding protein